VQQTVNWYSELAGAEQISTPGIDSSVARSQLQQQSLRAVHLAFDFGKAAEDMLGRESQAQSASAATGVISGKAAAPTMAAQLERSAANMASQEAALKAGMAAVDAQLRQTRGAKARTTLEAQRAGINAALQLVQQIESNIDQLRRFQESAIAGQGKPPKGLRAQLAALERSIPELATGEGPAGEAAARRGGASSSSTAHAAPAAASKPPATNFQPQAAGIVTLIGQWGTLHGYLGQIDGAIKITTALETELTGTRTRLL